MIKIVLDEETNMTMEEGEVKREVKRILNRFGRKKGNLVPILQRVQGSLAIYPGKLCWRLLSFLIYQG